MEDEKQNLTVRPPVVVIMGHVDHGKSKLLDYIRKSNIVESEAGGITQHIGAYEVVHNDKNITFLDTPGHEAFTKIRSRGAKIADIAILVVAADEGVKPQTIEAIKIIAEAKLPHIVAISKIDKPNADPQKIKNELGSNNVFLEGSGGTISSVNISAHTGEGIPELLELILLTAELEELRANKDANASGIIVESKLDPRKGISATLLIQDGTMKKGMHITAGDAMAPVRVFENFLSKAIDEASFSSPVKIAGFNKLPEVGVEFRTYSSKKEAEKALSDPQQKESKQTQAIKDGVNLTLIIKADAVGSLEGIESELKKLQSDDEVAFNILREGVGNINKDDIKLASSAKNALMIGFNVKLESGVKDFSEKFDIEIKNFDIIYKISDWLNEKIEKQKALLLQAQTKGSVKVIRIFGTKGSNQIIGGEVTEDEISTGKSFNIKRRGNVISEGKIIGLEKGKIKTDKIESGEQFGAVTNSKIEIIEGDILEILAKSV